METLFDVPVGAVNVVRWPRNNIGSATEHLTIAKLLELGYRVAVPVVDDDGVDLVVNYHFRVQVKCSRLHDMQPGAYPYWTFKSPTGWRADVYIFRGVSEPIDRWWITPHATLEANGLPSTVTVHPFRGCGKWGSLLAGFENAWHVFDG